MRDSLGNVIPAMTNPSPGAVKALRTPGLNPPVNPSPAAQQGIQNAAIRQTIGPRLGVRGLGTPLRAV